MWARLIIDRMIAAEAPQGEPASCAVASGQAMAAQIDWVVARLRATRELAPNVRLFEIEPQQGLVGPTPGSHIQVVVEIGGRPDIRHYSIIGPCRDGRYRIAVKRHADGRGGSAYMWSLAEGARLTISSPANHFALGYGRPEYLLIAGGIGITPIYTMALALAEKAVRFRLLDACRQGQDLAFADELHAQIGDRLTVLLDERAERIDLVAEIAGLHPEAELYVCGPIGLLEAARAEWRAQGRAADRLRFETFGNSGRFASETFSVHIPQVGRVIQVTSSETILSALEAAGIPMISDCRRGEWGACAVAILETTGIIDHRDVFFSVAEQQANDKLCACVSRVVGGSVTIDTGDRRMRPRKRAGA